MAHDSPAWGGPPIGDRYIAAKYSDAEMEQLAHDFALQAEKEHAPVVGRLRRAFELVLRDLGVDPASGFVEAIWLPSDIAAEIRTQWGRQYLDRTGELWTALVYMKGGLRLIPEIDASYAEIHLPLFMAMAIQDSLIEEVGDPRPICPLHLHPLAPLGTLTGPIWACRQGAQLWHCRMGTYWESVSSVL
jgi:hypothetical protein